MLQSYFWIIAFQECAFIERQKGIFVEKKNAANFFFVRNRYLCFFGLREEWRE
jgi:hypothetical protein